MHNWSGTSGLLRLLSSAKERRVDEDADEDEEDEEDEEGEEEGEKGKEARGATMGVLLGRSM